jgi:hypothetical protein
MRPLKVELVKSNGNDSEDDFEVFSAFCGLATLLACGWLFLDYDWLHHMIGRALIIPAIIFSGWLGYKLAIVYLWIVGLSVTGYCGYWFLRWVFGM